MCVFFTKIYRNILWLFIVSLLGVGNVFAVEKFFVYDGTLYKNKPNLKPYGFLPVTIIYGQEFWPAKKNMDSLPTKVNVSRIASKYKNMSNIQILDVEHWKLMSEFDVNSNLSKYLQILRWYKSSAPRNQVGYYGLPIGRDYWRSISSKDSDQYKEWQKENDRIINLAREVDISFPSLYTFFNDPDRWVQYAIENIKESRRINPGKPVYPFIWPQFHDSSFLLKGKYIPADFWRLQLDTIRQHADGVVIWGGWDVVSTNKPIAWDGNAEWWKVTKQFLAEQQ